MTPNKFITLWTIISAFIAVVASLAIAELSNQGLFALWYLIIVPIAGLILSNIIISIVVKKKYPKAKWTILKISAIYIISAIITFMIISYIFYIFESY